MVIQDKVVCARMGDVMVPSIGAVVSLARETGEDLIRALGFEAAGDGYYRWDGPEAVICLEPPGESGRRTGTRCAGPLAAACPS